MSGKRSRRQRKKARLQGRVGVWTVIQSRDPGATAPESSQEDALCGLADLDPPLGFAAEQAHLIDLLVSSWIELLEERIRIRDGEGSRRLSSDSSGANAGESTFADCMKDELLDELRDSCKTQPKAEWTEHSFAFARYELPRQRIAS